MVNLAPSSRQKIYLILVFASLILLFYNVWLVKPVIVGPEHTLGLASAMLTPGYWIGLALITLTSIFAFLDREMEKDAIFIIILIAFGLHLSGIFQIVQENPAEIWSGYLLPVGKNLLIEHHLNIAGPSDPLLYYSWPARHFINASIFGITEVSPLSLLKYGPQIWVLFFPFITYGIGKRFKLAPKQCFLISFLAVSSWLIGVTGGLYRIHTFATLLFLLLFMLLLTPKRTAAEVVAALLMFSALVLCHGLTALAVLPGLILLSIYRRDARFVLLFLVMFWAWYIYRATAAFETGIRAFTMLMQDIFQYTQVERYQEPASVSRLVARYVCIVYLVSYVVLMIGSAYWVLRRRITGERRKQVISLFCWAIGVGLLVLWGHGEVILRIYAYCLVPAVCIIVTTFSRKWLLIFLMCLFVALSPLFNYTSGNSSSESGQILTTELRGTEFLATKLKVREPFFYGYPHTLLMYHDPYYMGYGSAEEPSPPGKADISVLDELRYVMLSKQATEYAGKYGYAKGEDYPYDNWPQTEAGERADLIYNNGYFRIYENHLAG